MMMGRRFRRISGIGLAALCLAVTGEVQAQVGWVSDCADTSIRLVGIAEAASARCTGDGNGWSETVDASGPGKIFVIRHNSTNGNNYYWRLSAGEIVDRVTESMQVESRGEAFEVDDFDVMRYRAKPEGDGSGAACFAFVAYAGHVARSTGYRHSVVGSYCDLTGEEISDARVAELLGAIEADFW